MDPSHVTFILLLCGVCLYEVKCVSIEAKAKESVAGVCPDTDRSLVTLPWMPPVLLDEVSEGNTWIVVQRRVSGDVDFYRAWDAYVKGFGSLRDSFWLGLEPIHQLCNVDHKCQLLVHLKYDGEPKEVAKRQDGCYHAKYDEFYLGNATENYKLHIHGRDHGNFTSVDGIIDGSGGYSGTAGDSISYFRFNSGSHVHNIDGEEFSTYDRDNDWWDNCAEISHGAWWYKRCSLANVNGNMGGVFNDDEYQVGAAGSSAAIWYTLTGLNSVSFTEMKVRQL